MVSTLFPPSEPRSVTPQAGILLLSTDSFFRPNLSFLVSHSHSLIEGASDSLPSQSFVIIKAPHLTLFLDPLILALFSIL